MDLHVGAIVLVATSLGELQARSRERAVTALALATLLAAMPLAYSLATKDRIALPNRFDQTQAFIGDSIAPTLAENAMLPVLAGQRPYLLDSWMFRLLRQRDPSFAEPLWTKLRARAFSAVVLNTDPRTPKGRRWYRDVNFGDGFLEILNQNYEFAGAIGDQYIFRPLPKTSF